MCFPGLSLVKGNSKVCCSYVSSNIIYMGFALIDKVKSVVKDLVLFIYPPVLCPA